MEERTSANSKGNNRVEVPEAREALDRFKFEVANEIGVDLKEGYNGHLTTAQAGSVGGEMVRKMIRRQEEEMSGSQLTDTNESVFTRNFDERTKEKRGAIRASVLTAPFAFQDTNLCNVFRKELVFCFFQSHVLIVLQGDDKKT